MNMFDGSRPGAYLDAFRNYLPNSQICGADIDEGVLFTETRITTHVVDQLNTSLLSALMARVATRFALADPRDPKAAR